MNVREWMNQNSALTTIGALVIVILALGYAISHLTQCHGPTVRMPKAAYYYDIGTGKIFTDEWDKLAPIEAPSGLPDAGVLAHVYACDGCSSDLVGMTKQEVEQTGATIAFLEKYTEKGRQKLVEMRKQGTMYDPVEFGMEGKRFAVVPNDPSSPPQFNRNMMQLTDTWNKCPDAKSHPKPCFPESR